MARRQFYAGDPAPWFTCVSGKNPQFHFDTTAGRYVVVTFLGTCTSAPSAAAVKHVTSKLRKQFDDDRLAFFGVSVDPSDVSEKRIEEQVPGIRYFLDFDRTVSTLYGAIDPDQPQSQSLSYQCFTLVLDPFLRVLAHIPITEDETHNKTLENVLKTLPPAGDKAADAIPAPVLVLPRIFEPDLCKELIRHYEKQGGKESGFMQEKDGNTVSVKDHNFKRRKDFHFDSAPEYEDLRQALRARFIRRVVPEVQKAFQFGVTRIERYIVACYEGQTGGFFRAHRDNTTKGTAHRRFACTVNLNAEDYEGGELRFAEFGPRTYRAPTGGAVVFSCSLLHEATPVTNGKRYAFLPFLYDDAAAKIRDENRKFVTGESIDRTGAGGAAA